MIPLMVFGTISTKNKMVYLKDCINLETGNTVKHAIHPIYSCSAETGDTGNGIDARGDIFVNYIDISTCMCACPSAIIQFKKPFYQSKQPLSSMDINQVLNLKDSTLFTKIDTSHKAEYYSSDTCLLPLIFLSRYQSAVIITTIPSPAYSTRNVYVLITLTPVVSNGICDDNPRDSTGAQSYTMPHLDGYKMTWYIQDNGNSDFRGMVPIITNKNPGIKNFSEDLTGAEFYSLLGCKIPSAKIYKMHSICVIKRNNQLKLILK
jgi:hypothetical protein